MADEIKNEYREAVPIDKVIIDIHRFPKDLSLLILGPPGIGKSEGMRQFAWQEVLRLKEDMKIRCKNDMEILVLDNPEGLYKKVDEHGNITNKAMNISQPKNYIIFIDVVRTGSRVRNTLLNEHVNYLINQGNLVYLYLDIRLSEIEPSDLVGLPALVHPTTNNTKYSDYATNVFIDAISIDKSSITGKDTCEEQMKYVHGILFLDEFTNIQRADVLSMAFKIVLDRMIGFKRISKGVRIIAAGNYAKNSAIAQELPAPLINRFATIKTQKPSIVSWRNYMFNQIDLRFSENPKKRALIKKIAYAVSVFLSQKTYEEYFLSKDIPPQTLDPYPTPRSWSNAVFAVAPSIDAGKCTDVVKECFEFFPVFVGKEAYDKFITWFIGEFVPFKEEMLDYSKEELDKYFTEKGVYGNIARFSSFLTDYLYTIEDKKLWDHRHDLRQFFNNLVLLINEHKNELKTETKVEKAGETLAGTTSPYEYFIREIVNAFRRTVEIAGDDGIEKPLFKTITIDLANEVINDIIFNLTKKNNDQEIDQEIQKLKDKFSREPVYCVKLNFDYSFFSGQGSSVTQVGKIVKKLMNDACANQYEPVVGFRK